MSIANVEQTEIAELAQRLWAEAGHPEGRDLEFWLAAESQVRRPRSAAAPRPARGNGRTLRPSAKSRPQASLPPGRGNSRLGLGGK